MEASPNMVISLWEVLPSHVRHLEEAVARLGVKNLLLKSQLLNDQRYGREVIILT